MPKFNPDVMGCAPYWFTTVLLGVVAGLINDIAVLAAFKLLVAAVAEKLVPLMALVPASKKIAVHGPVSHQAAGGLCGGNGKAKHCHCSK